MERQKTSESHETFHLGLTIQDTRVWQNRNSTIELTEVELRVDNASVTSSEDSFTSDLRRFQSPCPSQHLQVANPSIESVRRENNTSAQRLIESSAGSPSRKEHLVPDISRGSGEHRVPDISQGSGEHRVPDISQGSEEHLVPDNLSDTSGSCVSSNVSTNVSDRIPPLIEEDELRIGLPVGSFEPSLTDDPRCDFYPFESLRWTGINRQTPGYHSTWENQYCTGARPDTEHLTVTNTSGIDSRTQDSSDHSDNGIYCIYSPEAACCNAGPRVDEDRGARYPSDDSTPAGVQCDAARVHADRMSSQDTTRTPNREPMPTGRSGHIFYQSHEQIPEFVSVLEQRSSASPPGQTSISSHSDVFEIVNGQEDELSLTSSKGKTRYLVIGMIFLCAVAVGGIAAYELLKRNQDPVLQHVYVADVDVKVNETFRDAMSDTTSAEFQQYQNRFCYNVGVSLSPTLDINNCSVHNLSRGSVVVAFRLHFAADRNMTASDLEQLIRKLAEEGTPPAHIGIIKVFANSVQVTRCEDTVEQNTGTKDGTGEPQEEFDCSKTTLHFLPLPYTFDGFCHEYQHCNNGKSELFSCAGGHEFSYSGNGGSVACEPASESTYCGIKRKNLGLTTPTTTAATTTTTQDANWTVLSTSANVPTSIAATTDLTTVSTETTRAIVYNCTPPVMQESQTKTYTCPDHGVSYIPDPNIYPDQCGTFIWCVDGHAYPYHCANGTHFTLGPEPCYWAGSPLTYCSTVKRWEDCRQGNVSSTSFEPVTATPPRDLMNTSSCAGVMHGFLPMNDTYPENCGKYHQCVREAEYIQSCPQGLHFTLEGRVCIPQNSTNTYCEQRKRS